MGPSVESMERRRTIRQDQLKWYCNSPDISKTYALDVPFLHHHRNKKVSEKAHTHFFGTKNVTFDPTHISTLEKSYEVTSQMGKGSVSYIKLWAAD